MSSNRARTIGVAGYMGSGKSRAAAFLAREGGMVIDADAVAKEMMNADAGIRAELGRAFGPEVLARDAVAFDVLGRRAFRSLDDLLRLNTVVHPALVMNLRARLAYAQSTTRVLDAALIPLWDIEDWFDILCWVDAPFEIRCRRLLRSTSLPEREIRRRMELQQELLPPPNGARWIVVRNAGTPDELDESLGSLARAVSPETFEP
ncbi:MAG: dephospho-CoA kinase [Chitinivibrionales bacterium]|nr:dephospho-CoA kinase [Chitinivibrionales bacterium]MBD3396239.1 dephospho-CoA kinase [Chitinivibrionales bacterium]